MPLFQTVHPLFSCLDPTTPQIALVPYSDERLQPRRTFLKLFTALTIAGIVIGVLLFVFLPRQWVYLIFPDNFWLLSASRYAFQILFINDSLLSAEAKTTLLSLESGVITPTFAWLNITDQASITNENYFSITVMSMNISLKCIEVGEHGDTVDVSMTTNCWRMTLIFVCFYILFNYTTTT